MYFDNFQLNVQFAGGGNWTNSANNNNEFSRTTNWNSGATGLMRYAVWMVPIFAWLIAEFLPPTRRLVEVVGLAVAFQAAILLRHRGRQDLSGPDLLR